MLIDAKEAARMLGISYFQLSRMRSEGKGPPAVKIGAHYKYRPQAIEAWILDQEQAMQRAGESPAQ